MKKIPTILGGIFFLIIFLGLGSTTYAQDFFALNADPATIAVGETSDITITRSGATAASLVVTIVNDDPAALNAPGIIIISAGTDSETFQVTGIGGGGPTLTAQAAGYNDGTVTLTVNGSAPTIEDLVVPSTATKCQDVNFSGYASDAEDPDNSLTYAWDFGDGATQNGVNLRNVTHQYTDAGTYDVSLSVTDSDGQTTSQSEELTVKKGFTLIVNIIPVGYNGWQGVGTGNYTLSVPANACGEYLEDTKVVITANPTALGVYDSFFYEWGGDVPAGDPDPKDFNPLTVTMDQDRTITLLFSREFYTYDNVGDLDGDALPDEWEQQWGVDPKDGVGAQGRYGNTDNDFTPSLNNNGGDYPFASGSDRLKSGYCTGPLFNNFYEARGYDGFYKTNGDTGVVPDDDPYTDPTDNDTDLDTLTDGWEYYFWRWRSADALTDRGLLGSDNLTWVTLKANIYNDPVGDTDGDGLTDSYEHDLNCTDPDSGTDPTHCDSDRDGMDDAWEEWNTLNPLDPDDNDDNPDGEEMAYDGRVYHVGVYQRAYELMEAGGTAFDPRTAWGEGDTSHPNTQGYNNLDEYLGGDRVPRIRWGTFGATEGLKLSDASGDDTDPNNWDHDGDTIPDGWELYVGMDPKSDGDRYTDNDGDGLNNEQEWENMRDENGDAASLGDWTNKLWPTDPGHIQYGEDNAGQRLFVWRNVWVNTRDFTTYEDGLDLRVFEGGETVTWTVADGTQGYQDGLYYNDANSNGIWDFGEDIWRGAANYGGADFQVTAGGDRWTTSDGTAGSQTGLYYDDLNIDTQYTMGESIWRVDADVYNTADVLPVWYDNWGAAVNLNPDVAGWRVKDGSVGRAEPQYFDYFINKTVYVRWGTPGVTTAGTTFNPATDAIWLDLDGGNVFTGEPVLVGTPTEGQQGFGLQHIFYQDADADEAFDLGEPVWVDATGNGLFGVDDTVIVPGAVAGIPGEPLSSVVGSSPSFQAGDAVWIDNIVVDAQYTHDIQIYPAAGNVLTGGEYANSVGLYYYHNDAHPHDTDYDGLEDGDGHALYGNIPYGEKTISASYTTTTTTTNVTDEVTDGVTNTVTNVVTSTSTSTVTGSNPTSIDTDDDVLPDGWEVYAGTDIFTQDAAPGQVDGTDEQDEDDGETYDNTTPGTASDIDADGLVNNLEYWTGAVYEWMHIDIHKFPNAKLVIRLPMKWDMRKDGNYAAQRDWNSIYIPPDFMTDTSFEVSNGQMARTADPYVFYHTTRADSADTDGDGMDDYWEIYHGLNPTKGAADYLAGPKTDGTRGSGSGIKAAPFSVGDDFTESPHFKFGTEDDGEWQTISEVVTALRSGVSDHIGPFNFGLELMDPDSDGIPNLEEYSFEAVDTGRSFHHTDPSPRQRTEVGPFSRLTGTKIRDASFTELNYTFDNAVGFRVGWKWQKSGSFPFKFESNEGADTDGDLISDLSEINSGEPNASGGSDPADDLSPVRNRALYFEAGAEGFLRAQDGASLTKDEDFLTRFTVECWVMPSTTNGNMVVLEKACQLPAAFGRKTVGNFMIALENGVPYGRYHGKNNLQPYFAAADHTYLLPVDRWSHLALTYDGTNLTLYVNGEIAATRYSTELPATGYNTALGQREMSTTIIGAIETDYPVAVINPDTGTNTWFYDDVIDGEPRYSTAGYSLNSLTFQLRRAVPIYATNFFEGYIDEVRVWDGAKAQSDILADMRSKIPRTSTKGNATLWNYYSFDACPDVDVNWENSLGQPVDDEPIIPYDIDNPDLQGPTLPLQRSLYDWVRAPQRSTIYYGSSNNTNDNRAWNYMVFARDLQRHAPRSLPEDDHHNPLRNTDGSFTGELPSGYKNSSNPYHDPYNMTRWAWERPNQDLLFFNGAQADGDVFVDIDAWFDDGPVDDPDARDSDGDGMPDDWETANGLDPNDATGENGATGDPDGDGLNNYYEYLSQTDPRDPITNPADGLDGTADPDQDGLPNTQEQAASTLPLEADTDDDGLSDGEEVNGTDNTGTVVTALVPAGKSDPANSLDPPVLRSMLFDGTGTLDVPPTDKLAATAFTLESWVYPTAAQEGIIIQRSFEDLTTGGEGINYELGLKPAATAGYMMPYVRFENIAGDEIYLDMTTADVVTNDCQTIIPLNEWSHIAATYNATNFLLKLFIDGKESAYIYNSSQVAPNTFGLGGTHLDDAVTIGENYIGYIDNMRMWGAARTAAQILDLYHGVQITTTTSETTQGVPFTSLNANEQLRATEILDSAADQAWRDGGSYTVAYSPAILRPASMLFGKQQSGSIDPSAPINQRTGLKGATPSSFDWRDSSGVTPIKDQGACGSCWAFATVAAFESAILISDGTTVDLSEQYLVSCNDDGWGCSGGFPAHKYHYDTAAQDGGKGAVFETAFPYQAADAACSGPYPRPYVLEGWGYLGSGPNDQTVTDAEIKAAIQQYGPVTMSLYAGTNFTAYAGGIFNTDEATAAGATVGNHCVLAVGWSDTDGYWIIKNSYGSSWGESGYMRIAYGTSLIGEGPSYVVYGQTSRVSLDLRFDDGGVTAEDFSQSQDWLSDWEYAATLNGGASFADFGAPANRDTDGDGMPDWWEQAYGLTPRVADATADTDGDGLENLYEYLAGTSPNETDTDLDGTTDLNQDSDGDQLSNGQEQNVYQSHPGLLDTDDDWLRDDVEAANGTDPALSLSPYVIKALDFTNNMVHVSDRVNGVYSERFSQTNWTVEVLVQPRVNTAAGDISLVKIALDCSDYANLDLGMTATGNPYIMFNDNDSGIPLQLVGGAQIPVGEWTHLAGRFSDGRLVLLVDGIPVRSSNTDFVPAHGQSELLMGANQNYQGYLKEIRVWKVGRTDDQIDNFKGRTLVFDKSAADPGVLQLSGAGELRETSFTIDSTDGEAIDDLEYWTLETWVKTTSSGTLISRWNDVRAETEDEDFNFYLGIQDNGKLIGRFSLTYVRYKFDFTSNTVSDVESVTDHTVNNIIGAVPVNDGVWHHVAYVRDATNAYLYVDGKLDNKKNSIVTPEQTDPDTFILSRAVRSLDGPLVIGTGLSGMMDEIRVWNRGLSASELNQVANKNLTGSESGLITYFNFDYQTGDDATERADIRDRDTEYGRYIPNAALLRTSDGPPITFNPIRVYEDIALTAYYTADDGGTNVQDYVYGNDMGYGGTLVNGTVFTVLSVTNRPYTDDSDGDGLPDWWETMHGLDPGSDEGDDGACGDPDGDGLNNRAEYLSWLQPDGQLDPQNFDTWTNGVSDYFAKNTNGIPWGTLTDQDDMYDCWEVQHPDSLSPLTYDAHQDPDLDGWSNYDEYMASTDPTDNSSHPTPGLYFNVRYEDDIYTEGTVRFEAYSINSADCIPDAEGTINEAQVIPDAEISYSVGSSNGVSDSFNGTLSVAPVVQGSLELTLNTLVFKDLGNGTLRSASVSPNLFGTIDYESGAWTVTTTPESYVNPTVRASWSSYRSGYSFPVEGVANITRGGLRKSQQTHFFTWLDVNDDGVYQTNEPAGYPREQPFNLSWGDLEDIDVLLTDKRKGYHRFTWEDKPQSGADMYYVTVRRNDAEGYILLRDIPICERTYFYELDFIRNGILGLPHNSGYEYFVKTDVDELPFTNGLFLVESPTPTTPVPLIPVGGTVDYARLQLVWRMDPATTSIDLEIFDSSGATVYSVYSTPAYLMPDEGPYRGEYRYDVPLLAGESPLANGSYTWRVKAKNALAESGWSTTGAFTVDIKPEAQGGASGISGELNYYGPITISTNTPVYVQAFDSDGFSGKPAGQTKLTSINTADFSADFEILGLRSDTYYVLAYIDSNGNGIRDFFESFGMIRDPNAHSVDYLPTALELGASITGTHLIIRDLDTDDDDQLIDAWEYQMYGALNVARPNDDEDGDGLTTVEEMYLGSSPFSSDTDGDGLSDINERVHGTSPTSSDTDSDGAQDNVEVVEGTNPLNRDSDSDGLYDGLEIYMPSDPLSADGDNDGIPDYIEYNASKTSLLDTDTDDDGFSDILEYVGGYDPNDIANHPSVQGLYEINSIDMINGVLDIGFDIDPALFPNALQNIAKGVKVILQYMDQDGNWYDVPDQRVDQQTTVSGLLQEPAVDNTEKVRIYRLRWELEK